jgi:hypothetical protein
LEPARLVASIYADGREGAVWAQRLDGARRGEWFSHSLTALWARCDARAHNTGDGLGRVDFDVATNSRGRWAIDDIHSVIEPNAWSLRAILKQYLVR